MRKPEEQEMISGDGSFSQTDTLLIFWRWRLGTGTKATRKRIATITISLALLALVDCSLNLRGETAILSFINGLTTDLRSNVQQQVTGRFDALHVELHIALP